jgi:hypothetical protein
MHSDTRWKVAGVAVGAAALVTTTTAAYACIPGAPSVRAADGVAFVKTTDVSETPVTTAALAKAAIVAGEEKALAYVSALVARLQAKADSLGSPSTLTPRQAARIERAIALASFLQTRLADIGSASSSVVPAADINDANALATQLGTIKSRLTSVLANATIVRPTSKSAVDPASFVLAATSADPTRHHCDGDHAGTRFSGFRSGDGGHHRSGGDWSRERYDGSRR